MKKLLFILIVALLLAACNNETLDKNQSTNEKVEEEVDATLNTESEENIVEENNEPQEKHDVIVEEATILELKKIKEETSQPLTEAVVKEILEFNSIGAEDTLVNFSIDAGEIKATITLASSDMFTPEDIAITRCSQLSDELLFHKGWETLTVTYENIGTVSMYRK
ncbi:hypothetical protein [Bacillus sp. 2205SS5-2]|uniref:hypothetical protein n=1 Tax=Bacillus sp. 2205SS5-2 TaxID=3109031 RepID=UPI0030046030